MSMQMGDSSDMIYGSSSGGVLGRFRNRSVQEQILWVVNIALGITVLGFIIGVATIRSRINDDLQSINALREEIWQCEANSTSSTVSPFTKPHNWTSETSLAPTTSSEITSLKTTTMITTMKTTTPKSTTDSSSKTTTSVTSSISSTGTITSDTTTPESSTATDTSEETSESSTATDTSETTSESSTATDRSETTSESSNATALSTTFLAAKTYMFMPHRLQLLNLFRRFLTEP